MTEYRVQVYCVLFDRRIKPKERMHASMPHRDLMQFAPGTLLSSCVESAPGPGDPGPILRVRLRAVSGKRMRLELGRSMCCCKGQVSSACPQKRRKAPK